MFKLNFGMNMMFTRYTHTQHTCFNIQNYKIIFFRQRLHKVAQEMSVQNFEFIFMFM